MAYPNLTLTGVGARHPLIGFLSAVYRSLRNGISELIAVDNDVWDAVQIPHDGKVVGFAGVEGSSYCDVIRVLAVKQKEILEQSAPADSVHSGPEFADLGAACASQWWNLIDALPEFETAAIELRINTEIDAAIRETTLPRVRFGELRSLATALSAVSGSLSDRVRLSRHNRLTTPEDALCWLANRAAVLADMSADLDAEAVRGRIPEPRGSLWRFCAIFTDNLIVVEQLIHEHRERLQVRGEALATGGEAATTYVELALKMAARRHAILAKASGVRPHFPGENAGFAPSFFRDPNSDRLDVAAAAAEIATLPPFNAKEMELNIQLELERNLAGAIVSEESPNWDKKSRKLTLGGQVVKAFRQAAPDQFAILNGFQEEGWPTHLDDPIKPRGDTPTATRLRNTIKQLNDQNGPAKGLISFTTDGLGRGVCWALNTK